MTRCRVVDSTSIETPRSASEAGVVVTKRRRSLPVSAKKTPVLVTARPQIPATREREAGPPSPTEPATLSPATCVRTPLFAATR